MDTWSKILEYLKQLSLFIFGEPNLDHLNYPSLIFLLSTSVIGLLCVFLDFTYYKTTKGKSIFNLSYIGKKGVFSMFLFWGIGAGIVGFLSMRLELITDSVQASIIVGLGWPLIFPRLYSYANANINELEPEEEFTAELEEEFEERPEEESEEKHEEESVDELEKNTKNISKNENIDSNQ